MFFVNRLLLQKFTLVGGWFRKNIKKEGVGMGTIQILLLAISSIAFFGCLAKVIKTNKIDVKTFVTLFLSVYLLGISSLLF